MTYLRPRERGEGKIGCMVTLAVFILAGAVAAKVIPVLFDNSNLAETADDLASKAGILSVPALELQLRDKARSLEIPEALAPGAIQVTVAGDRSNGLCTIRLKYARKIDFYGAYTFTLETDKKIAKPYMDAR